ncbi:cytochrome P450 [Cryobacterium sp. TMS1-20-1]|uniref:cytochrome P450 n=1 Tax=Cryobacterium sp. TMS1-20-1 TaxID=1259223 RepID=UPI0010697263|nr:cytochrome P450 [Cryobacterium sp. TMS1-20-1]TFC80061.1 cytochrome P450 [Cryobacterium sp. TMS1-20-1]
MTGPVPLPGLSIAERRELFPLLLEAAASGAELVQVAFRERSGWLVLHAATARELLRNSPPKGRGEISRSAVGGYPSHDGEIFRRRRRDVVAALSLAGADIDGMTNSLGGGSPSAAPTALPPRRERSAYFTAWMIGHLAGASAGGFDTHTLTRGIDDVMDAAKRAQAGEPAEESPHRDLLVLALSSLLSTGRSPFLDHLRDAGWRDRDIVGELVVLAAAGWESTAAVVTSAVALGMSSRPSTGEVDELLRLFPASWLIVRALTGSEPWGQRGDLAVVSPWLIHRSDENWPDAGVFDPERFAEQRPHPGYMPFGSGPRRCPADSYARSQVAVAMGRFGGGPDQQAEIGLLDCRSSALIPTDDRDEKADG